MSGSALTPTEKFLSEQLADLIVSGKSDNTDNNDRLAMLFNCHGKMAVNGYLTLSGRIKDILPFIEDKLGTPSTDQEYHRMMKLIKAAHDIANVQVHKKLTDIIENTLPASDMPDEKREFVIKALSSFVIPNRDGVFHIKEDATSYIKNIIARNQEVIEKPCDKHLASLDDMLKELNKYIEFVNSIKPNMSEGDVRESMRLYDKLLVKDAKGGIRLPALADEMIRDIFDKKIRVMPGEIHQLLGSYNNIKQIRLKSDVYDKLMEDPFAGFTQVQSTPRGRSNAVAPNPSSFFQPAPVEHKTAVKTAENAKENANKNNSDSGENSPPAPR